LNEKVFEDANFADFFSVSAKKVLPQRTKKLQKLIVLGLS